MTRSGSSISAEQERRLLHYLSGEMDAGEVREFESEILADDALAERLYSLQGIDGLIGLGPHGATEGRPVLARPRRSSMGRRIGDWLRPPRIWIPAAAAVALIVAAFTSVGPFRSGEGGERMRSLSVRPAPIFPLGELPQPPERLVWSAALGAAGYRVLLLDESAVPVFEAVTSDTAAAIPDSISSRLHTGTWIVIPRDRKGAELQGSKPATFRVRAP